MKPANYTLRTRLLYRARWYGRPGNNVWRLLPDGRSVSSLADQKWSGTFGKPIASFAIAFSHRRRGLHFSRALLPKSPEMRYGSGE